MEEESGEDAINLNENQNSKLLEEFEASMVKLQFKVVKEIEILMKFFQNEMETAVTNFKQNFKAELIKNNPERTDNGKERCVSDDESNQSRNVSKTEENKDVPATAKGVSEDVLTGKFEVKTELETTPEKEQKVESNEQKSVNETNEKSKRFFSIHGPKPATGFRFNCKSNHVRKSIAKKVDSLLPTMVSQRSTYTQHYGQLPKPNNNENSFLSVSCASVNSPASHPRPVKILPKPRYYPYSCTSINVRNQRPTVCQSFIATPRPEQQNREQTTLNAQQNFPYENIVEQQQSLVKSPKILSQDELIRILKAAQGNSDGTNFNNSNTFISKTPLSETETVATTPTMSDTTESVSVIDVNDDERSKSQTRILSDQNINNRLENEISDLEVDTVFGSSFRGSKYCTKKQLMEAMRFAGRFGVAEASRKFNIPSQHLTYWYRKYGKPRVEQLPDYIDRDLIDHIIEYKKTHLNEHLGAYAVFILARQFLQRKYPGTLYEEGGWVTLKDRWIEGFVKRLVDREKVLISDEQALKQMNQLNPLIVLAAELMKAQNQNFEKERK